MATITKFYLHDAATPNTGTMPSNSPAVIGGGVVGAGTEATGASTARDATDTIGVANPDTESSITAAATTAAQRLGHRRYVSRPLAAQQVSTGSNTWTFSAARSQSNANHNASIRCGVYAWRPSTGAQVGVTIHGGITLATFTGTTETAASATHLENGSVTIQDGDILVFDVYDEFTQGMNVAYTGQFAYDGATEASATTCASFVLSPVALTLFTAGTTYTKAGHGVEHG